MLHFWQTRDCGHQLQTEIMDNYNQQEVGMFNPLNNSLTTLDVAQHGTATSAMQKSLDPLTTARQIFNDFEDFGALCVRVVSKSVISFNTRLSTKRDNDVVNHWIDWICVFLTEEIHVNLSWWKQQPIKPDIVRVNHLGGVLQLQSLVSISTSVDRISVWDQWRY